MISDRMSLSALDFMRQTGIVQPVRKERKQGLARKVLSDELNHSCFAVQVLPIKPQFGTDN